MASRVVGFSEEVEDEQQVESTREVFTHHAPVVTKELIDEAVEEVLGGADSGHAAAIRRLMAMDPGSELTQAYFATMIKNHANSSFAALVKKRMTIEENLTRDEVVRITEYAPEFDLIFKNTKIHDHPFYSARRKIDHALIMGNIPPNNRYLDIGGKPLFHVKRGDLNCVTVAPFNVDAKDASRASLAAMELQTMVQNARASPEQRQMAASILMGEQRYHVAETAQTVRVQADFSISCHVYDVPIQDWPAMMERCNVRVHEGCLHFSNQFFSQSEGDLPYSGTHYEIDEDRDIFRMRIGSSHAPWYEHKWSDYMRYGANQILTSAKFKYSYQIIERRQDTIFFRILRVGPLALPDRDQVYALPDVPMVEVKGFEITPTSTSSNRVRKLLQQKTYYFTQDTWNVMHAFASSELERGQLSYEKLFSFYRTRVPRQTINSVKVSGGNRVPMNEVAALVVMSAVVASMDAILRHRAIRARTDEIQRKRVLSKEWTAYKVLKLFLQGLSTAGFLLLMPLAGLPEWTANAYTALHSDMMVSWMPQVRYMSLNAAVLDLAPHAEYRYAMPDQIGFRATSSEIVLNQYLDLASNDSQIATDMVATYGKYLPDAYKAKFAADVGSPSVKSGGEVSGTTVVNDIGTTVFERDGRLIRRTASAIPADEVMVADRRQAVKEAILECETETDALTAKCHKIYSQFVVNGAPQESILRKRSAEAFNADLWLVRDGVFVSSVLDPDSNEVAYSGVYVPTPLGGVHLVPVVEKEYNGRDHLGKAVHRVHYRLAGSFSGYVLVLDMLKIFNGPAIARALQDALGMPDQAFMFHITCHQGPPGCGKTTTVVRDSDPDTDVYMVPTRMAAASLRERLIKVKDLDPQRARSLVSTLDSFLMHYGRYMEKLGEVTVARLDEYVLARYGKWVAAVVLAGCKYVHAYGDSMQIKHVPRVDVPKFFLDMVHQVLEEEFVSHRCAPALIAAINFVYKYEIRSSRKEFGELEQFSRLSDVQWLADCRLLTMYQADKKYLQQFASGLSVKPKISTVHEAQGTDCDHVVLFNSETRKRTPEEAAYYLYAKESYCLVAISRARVKFTYVKMSREEDVITRMIENAKDPRRVSAARDLATQGQSIEFK